MDDTQKRNGEVLNWLLEGVNDSAEGFRQGTALARNPQFQARFSERAEQREELADKIAGEVRSFDLEPLEGGTFVGDVHRAFTHLRNAMGHDSDKALVEELLRRERGVADRFQAALDDSTLPSQARSVATAALPSFTEAAEELATLLESREGQTMSAHFKLNEDDNRFLEIPEGSAVLSAGLSGTESWIERCEDTVVRIGIQSVAIATAAGGSLSVSIEVGDSAAKGRDGPGPIEYRLTATQSVDVLVKARAGLRFKANAVAEGAQILRTVVWSSDVRETPQTKVVVGRKSSVEASNGAAAENGAQAEGPQP